ncbi:hypothetical protein ACNI65_06230 [Roseateles sp. So40a]|uniref:hypothetical protein n=1 Tax=Roseateles sp. So40a TaxID=3400226 RepID=UPI003A86719D
MSTKVTLKQRKQDGSTPGFRLYRDVLDEFGVEHHDLAPIFLQLTGVQAQIETMATGGAKVLLTLPHGLARELGLMSSSVTLAKVAHTNAAAQRQLPMLREQEPVRTERWVQQTVDVDSALDEAVRATAKRQGLSKGEVFRSFVVAGIAKVATSPLKRPQDSSERLHRRTMNFPPDLHAEISGLSVANRLTKSEVLRQLAKRGLKALTR